MLKKFLLFGIIIIIIGFSYFHQTPIIDENEAIAKATEILQNPPSEWDFNNLEIDNIQQGDIEAYITPRTDSIFNKLFNKQQWGITVKSQDIGVTIFLDAYSGKLISIEGQFN